MRTLVQYIKEDFNIYKLTDVEVQYLCQPKQEYIKFHLPETYSEDDFLVYIQDMYFTELPGDAQKAEKYFGTNASNIYDVLFEYDKYEKGVDEGDCVEWDPNIDNKHNPNDEKFIYVQVLGLRYVIKFDNFELKANTITQIPETLADVFKAVEADNSKLPLQLQLDEKNIKYTDNEI